MSQNRPCANGLQPFFVIGQLGRPTISERPQVLAFRAEFHPIFLLVNPELSVLPQSRMVISGHSLNTKRLMPHGCKSCFHFSYFRPLRCLRWSL